MKFIYFARLFYIRWAGWLLVNQPEHVVTAAPVFFCFRISGTITPPSTPKIEIVEQFTFIFLKQMCVK